MDDLDRDKSERTLLGSLSVLHPELQTAAPTRDRPVGVQVSAALMTRLLEDLPDGPERLRDRRYMAFMHFDLRSLDALRFHQTAFVPLRDQLAPLYPVITRNDDFLMLSYYQSRACEQTLTTAKLVAGEIAVRLSLTPEDVTRVHLVDVDSVNPFSSALTLVD